jgi:hypothetical protein
MIVGMVMSFSIGVFWGWIFMANSYRKRWQRECVKHGVAQYNSTTGTWEWKERHE